MMSIILAELASLVYWYFRLIEENEKIVDFASQDVSSSTTVNQARENFQIEVGEEEENDILIPDEHPEHFTSLEELQERAEGI